MTIFAFATGYDAGAPKGMISSFAAASIRFEAKAFALGRSP
jgi:hypothetical protein